MKKIIKENKAIKSSLLLLSMMSIFFLYKSHVVRSSEENPFFELLENIPYIDLELLEQVPYINTILQELKPISFKYEENELKLKDAKNIEIIKNKEIFDNFQEFTFDEKKFKAGKINPFEKDIIIQNERINEENFVLTNQTNFISEEMKNKIISSTTKDNLNTSEDNTSTSSPTNS